MGNYWPISFVNYPHFIVMGYYKCSLKKSGLSLLIIEAQSRPCIDPKSLLKIWKVLQRLTFACVRDEPSVQMLLNKNVIRIYHFKRGQLHFGWTAFFANACGLQRSCKPMLSVLVGIFCY